MLEGGRCRVYPVKPVPCSTFPFWEGALASPEAWQETGARCEGVDQGDLYDDEEITRLLAGDPRPLLEKHARPPEQEVVRRAPPPAAEAGPPPADAPDPEPSDAEVPAARWEAAFADLEALYARLAAELPSWGFSCSASGACCDFDRHGHRLYASTIEWEWFERRTPRRANEDARACPAWGPDRLCRSREGRMLGCRVYFCPPYPRGTPEDLYAPYHEEIRALHDRHGIPYAYRDVVEWAALRMPPGAPAPAPRPPG
jgi:Fe-S-cluster containining protein